MAKQEKRDWLEQARAEAPAPASGPGAPAVGARNAEVLETWALLFLVFVCGASLMGLEIVGGRALSPYFGSSVFVWGAIIGIFMAALAAGYYLGGLLADRRPSLGWLSAIVGIAGAMVIALTQLSTRVCNAVDGMGLGPRAAPLVASLALYFPPSLFLGAVSPFAVRLQARAVSGMGNVAGRLYALSTVGSLLGTLATTFALIPAMRTTRIMYLLGVVLLAAAVLAMAARFAARGAPRSRRASAAAALFLAAPFVLAYFFSPTKLPGSIPSVGAVTLSTTATRWQYVTGERESPYHIITVVRGFSPVAVGRQLLPHLNAVASCLPISLSPGDVIERCAATGMLPPLRAPRSVLELAARMDPDAFQEMRFSNLTESALYLNRPGRPPATTYTQILHLGMAFHPAARRVLVVGLGGGSLPRQFCELYGPEMRVDVVEIDPTVLEIARQEFDFRDGGAYRAFVEDGRQFLRRSPEQYDLIVLDAYSGGGQIPVHLTTRQFLELVREHLAPGGVLASNIISSLDGPMARFYRAEYKTLGQLFPNVYVFPSHRDRPEEIRNLILVAPREGGPRLTGPELVAKAEALTAKLLASVPEADQARRREIEGLNLKGHAERYQPTPEPAKFTDVPVLTDDYAPVETMIWYH